jgi:hypothetical protein
MTGIAQTATTTTPPTPIPRIHDMHPIVADHDAVRNVRLGPRT